MTLRVYNTLSGKKEAFEPIETGRVRMYVCGPTVYDSCHIGHARSVVVFDVILRYLRCREFSVSYVRNFTDIDDKIIKRANELGKSCKEIAEKYITEFNEDMDALNVLRPDEAPQATAYIDQIIAVIEKLIEKEMAYAVDGDVFFAVERFNGYGKLSGRKLADMAAGARIEVDERKRSPFDFALWKSAKPKEPYWDSPWGNGRPGWHIECSAMSREHLGETFDIHGGGKDLIFPHHENEIAQSEGAFDKPYVKYWLHNGFVNINHEKMAKSLGNFIMIRDVLKTYHPEAIRLFLLTNHYRSPIDFTDTSMDEAASGLDKIYAAMKRIDAWLDAPPDPSSKGSAVWTDFCEAMDDDFNTARGIGVLFEAVRTINRRMDECEDNNEAAVRDLLCSLRADIGRISNVLGILTEQPVVYFEKKTSAALAEKAIDSEAIDKLVHARTEARKTKDFANADRIRKELEAMNVILEDRPDGTVWRVRD